MKNQERLLYALVRYYGDCSALKNYQEFIRSNLQQVLEILVLPWIAIT